MKKNLFFGVLLSCVTVLWGCKEQSDDELTLKDTTLDNVTMALATPTSTTKGMKNYESYYKSAVDGKIHGYIVSVPLDYDPAKVAKYPLLVFYHGVGERPIDNKDYDLAKLKIQGPHKQIYSRGRAFPAVIASIQLAKWEGEFNPAVTKEFVDILTGTIPVPAQTAAAVGLGAYNINTNRIHLSGLSLGGYGTYKAAFTYPNLFASISEFSGYTDSQVKMCLIKIPVYIRHNDKDPVIAVGNAYNAQKWINAVNPTQPVNMVINVASGHNSWDREYVRTDNESVYEWHWSKYKGGADQIPSGEAKPISITGFAPAKNAIVAAATSTTLSLVFNTDVRKGSGTIMVKNLTENRTLSIDVNASNVKVTGNKVEISAIKLYDKTAYSLQITKGAFKDELYGTDFGGITDDNTWTFTVGTTETALRVTSFTPATNGPVVAATATTLTLLFSADVKIGSGTFTVKNLTAGRAVSTDISSSTIKITGNKVEIYPIKLYDKSVYAFQISKGAFTDTSGKEFAGILDDTTWTFTVGTIR